MSSATTAATTTMNATATVNATATAMMTLLTATTICLICHTEDLVIPCQGCHRHQCLACFSPDLDEQHLCEGCRMDRLLGLDLDQDPAPSPQGREEPKKKGPILLEPGQPGRTSGQPIHLIEKNTLPFHGITYPDESHWKQVEQILMSHIQFTTSSEGIQEPKRNTRYLVGRVNHRFTNRAVATTDYLMVYERNPYTGTYEWSRYIATYYDKSPIPHDVNLFYPYPLPLQFQ